MPELLLDKSRRLVTPRAVTHGAQSRAKPKRPEESAELPLVDVTDQRARAFTVPPRVVHRRRDKLGSKSKHIAWQTIINQMPPHRTYIEPFLGWGAVMRHKATAAHSICIDREERKVNNFLLELATVHPTMRSGIVSSDDELWGRLRGCADEPPGRLAAATKAAALVGTAVAISAQAPTTALIVGDALAFLAKYPWRGDELVYADPPYVHETRSDLKGCHYLFEMADADHEALLAILMQVPAPVILSGYKSELYCDVLRTWRVVTYKQATHRGDVRIEHLWCNFPEPVELHDYRYLGRNFRERQDFNRMRKRWIGKLAKMPLLKRRALLAAIKEANPRS